MEGFARTRNPGKSTRLQLADFGKSQERVSHSEVIHETVADKSSWLLAGGLAVCLATAAHAAPLIVDNISPLDAANQISDKYGINIVFKGDFSRPRTSPSP